MKKFVFLSCVLLMSVFGGGAEAASEFERIAPNVPKALDIAPDLLDPEMRTSNDETVLVARLNGLILLSALEDVEAGGTSAKGIDLSHLPANHPGLGMPLEGFLGQPVTLAELDRISAAIVNVYRAAGRPLVDVLIPEQDITAGTVQVAVLEFRLGEVRAEGNAFTSDERLVAEIRSEPGHVIDAGNLVDDVRWLNRSPFRQVRLVLERGDTFGETDIVLQTKDQRPWRIYAGADNTGSRTTGWERFFAGFNLGNLFGLDGILAYQATTDSYMFSDGALPHGLSANDSRYFAHSFSYTVPLPWRHEASVFGYYSEVHPAFGTPLTSEGRSWQVSGRYTIPLPGIWDMSHELVLGGDFKRTDNDLAFGGTAVSSSSTDVVQAVFGWSGNRSDQWGTTGANAKVFVSPGGLSAFNNSRDYQPSVTSAGRAGAGAGYAYATVELTRDQRLIDGFWMKGRLAGQVSSVNLLPSEQFSLGGATTVRGFRESEVLGDHGYLTSVELHAPLQTPLSSLGAEGDLDIYLFLDHGKAILQHAMPGENKQTTLTSAGIGFSYDWRDYASVRASYGEQLVGSSIDPADDRILSIRLVLSY